MANAACDTPQITEESGGAAAGPPQEGPQKD